MDNINNSTAGNAYISPLQLITYTNKMYRIISSCAYHFYSMDVWRKCSCLKKQVAFFALHKSPPFYGGGLVDFITGLRPNYCHIRIGSCSNNSNN